MEDIDISTDSFYTELEKIKLYYRNLLKYEVSSDLEEKSSENIQNINALMETFKEDQLKASVDTDERLETLYLEMKELYDTYKEAGKEDVLDFTQEEISKLIKESKESMNEDDSEIIQEDLEVVHIIEEENTVAEDKKEEPNFEN